MKLPDLSSAICQTHIALQSSALKAINRNLTLRNWLIGFYIIEFEQRGEDRAQYGTNLLKTLEKQVNTRGLTETLFKLSRQFYIIYPQIKDMIVDQLNTIRPTLSDEFNLQLSSTVLSIPATLSQKLQNTDNQLSLIHI